MKLSILIPVTPDRYVFLGKLVSMFEEQLPTMLHQQKFEAGHLGKSYSVQTLIYDEVEIVICDDNKALSIGEKRNILLRNARGEYIAFFDSDDRPSPDYVKQLFRGIEKGVDVCSLSGIITTNGQNPQVFLHSMEYNGWYEKNKILYRFCNHLNCIKKSIAEKIGFFNISHGEDKDYSDRLQKSGLVKTEHKIGSTIYYYDYIKGKK